MGLLYHNRPTYLNILPSTSCPLCCLFPFFSFSHFFYSPYLSFLVPSLSRIAQISVSPGSNSSGSAVGGLKDVQKKASPRRNIHHRRKMEVESDGSTEETDSSENWPVTFQVQNRLHPLVEVHIGAEVTPPQDRIVFFLSIDVQKSSEGLNEIIRIVNAGQHSGFTVDVTIVCTSSVCTWSRDIPLLCSCSVLWILV